MVAERMAAGVAAGFYNVEQMAAVTFTRKAASELRGRFHLALERSISASPSSLSGPTANERADCVRLALANMERWGNDSLILVLAAARAISESWCVSWLH